MEPATLQQLFFRHLKAILPGHLSLVDEVAELLDISNDSAYRRIRGEKPISMEEIQKLCIRYHISLDQLINIESNSTIFYGKNLDGNNFDLDRYLDYLLLNLKEIDKASKKMLFYEAKDMPLFYYFYHEELAALKFFFWMKTALVCPGYSKMYFEDNELKEILNKKGNEIIKTHNHIPSTEIWSIDSLNATLRQIEYYSYTGVFRKRETIELLYNQLDQTIEHIKEQAEYGEKFLAGHKPKGDPGNYHLYYNEWFLGNNSVLVETDGITTVYINHSVMNQIITKDDVFCDYTKNSLNNIIKKSLLISSVGEKERNRFFNKLLNKIAASRKEILQ